MVPRKSAIPKPYTRAASRDAAANRLDSTLKDRHSLHNLARTSRQMHSEALSAIRRFALVHVEVGCSRPTQSDRRSIEFGGENILEELTAYRNIFLSLRVLCLCPEDHTEEFNSRLGELLDWWTRSQASNTQATLVISLNKLPWRRVASAPSLVLLDEW